MEIPQAILKLGVDADARRQTRAKLTEFNRTRSDELGRLYGSELDKARPLEVYAWDLDGKLLGGAYGSMRWSWFALDVLWVEEAYRGIGLGSQLLSTAEEAARREGALAVTLDTYDFQARGFYERHGYVLFGELKGFPRSHTQFYLVKRFF